MTKAISCLFSLAVCFFASCANKHSHPKGLPGALAPIASHPLIEAYHQEQPLQLSPDTGAAQPLILFKNSVSQLGLSTLAGSLLNAFPIQVTYTPNADHGFEQAFLLDAPVADFDGLIGWPEIQRGIWHLNLPNREHQFHSQLPPHVRNWQSFDIIANSDVLRIKIDAKTTAILDTGATRAIHLSSEAFEQWLNQHPQSRVTLYGGYSPASQDGFFAKRCTRASNFKLGKLTFNQVVLYETFVDKAKYTKGSNTEILLGLETFANRQIWIDGPGQKVYLGNTEPSAWTPQRISLVGAIFIPNSKGTLVAHVLPESLAHRAGLRTGDELLNLNGRRHFSRSELQNALSLPGRRTRLQVQRSNRYERISWTVPTRP